MFAGDPPVAVASHLFHYLAVDLVLQGVVLGGRAEDLISQLDRMASVLGGVVTHIPQDGWQEKRLRSNYRYTQIRKTGNPQSEATPDGGFHSKLL